jgi:hypothetical protein
MVETLIMKSIRLLFAFCALLFAVACRHHADPEVAALEKSTMHIHDEAMKGLADMNRRARGLKSELKSLDDASPRKSAILDTLQLIETADTEMHDWMRNYKAPSADLPAADAKAYLMDQKAKIELNYQHIQALVK